MFLVRHALRLVLRDPRRSFAAALGVAIAAALMTSVLLFGSASGSTVTKRALAELPIDAQVVLLPGADPAAATAIVQADPAVDAALPFELVTFDAASLQKQGSATQTSVGVIIGTDHGYTGATGLFKVAQGASVPGQITVSRDLATNLGAVPGDTIAFTLPAGGSTSLKVSGVADITRADLILGPVDAVHRAATPNPPVNVAVLDRASLDAIAATIPAGATAADPGAAQGGNGSPVSSATPAVRRELQLRYERAQVPGDPLAAQTWLDSVRRRIERQGAGTFQVVDDASASLQPVAGDLAWGRILFVFLALPGILLALALSRLAADATAEATRRHAALLRARGATTGQLRWILLGATAITALVAALVGAGVGAAVGWSRFGPELATTDPLAAMVSAALAATVVVTVLATLAAALPLRDQLRAEVASGRQELQRGRAPLWQRLYLDVLALLGAVVVFFVTGGTGLHPILNAEGDPTVSLALTAFLTPLLLWIGATLLLLRLTLAALRRGRPALGWLGRVLGPGGELAGRSLQSRAAAASRTVVLLALTVSFATSLLVFDATYRQQQRVDAALTLGADLKAVPTMPTDAAALGPLSGSGVSSVTPFADRIVYVGSEAQDLLAIDPTTLPATSPLSDTFFEGSTASAAMQALAATPSGVLVSSETAKDYSIVPGDRLRIRVPDRNGNLVSVDFQMAGIALEFPTAPKDAFLVGNLSYVASATGDGHISYALARASGDLPGAARSLQSRLGDGWHVSDLEATTARLANGITSVDLGDLVTLEVLFSLLIAAVGSGLFLLAELSVRRRELATMEAIGAEPAQLRAAITGEVLVMGIAGSLAGIVVGALVGTTLLQVLAGLFDPPANLPVFPAAAVALLVVSVAVGLAAAVAVAVRALAGLGVLSALRER